MGSYIDGYWSASLTMRETCLLPRQTGVDLLDCNSDKTLLE